MEFCFLGGILLEPPSKDCFGDAAFTGGGFETFTPTSSSPWNLSLSDARTPPRASAGTAAAPTFLESTSTLPGVVTVPAWVLDAMPQDGVSPRAGVAPVTGESPVSPCATSASAAVASSSIASAAACSILLSTLLVPSAPPPIAPSSPSSTLLNESARLKLRRGCG